MVPNSVDSPGHHYWKESATSWDHRIKRQFDKRVEAPQDRRFVGATVPSASGRGLG
jgi:hypothetical protein